MRSISIMRTLPIWVLTVTAAVIGGAAADPMVPSGNPGETATANTGQSGRSGQPFSNPPEIASANGLLSATLTVGPAELTVAGQNVTFPALYDGLYTPPGAARAAGRHHSAFAEQLRATPYQRALPRLQRDPAKGRGQHLHQHRPGRFIPIRFPDPQASSPGPLLVSPAPRSAVEPPDRRRDGRRHHHR